MMSSMKTKTRSRPRKRVHEALDGLCCGFQSKWHEEELKEAKRIDNSCLWNVNFVQRNVMKVTYEVYLREESFSF